MVWIDAGLVYTLAQKSFIGNRRPAFFSGKYGMSILLIIMCIIKYHEAMYTWYRPIRQTKMPANVHYAPIHPTYCSSNILHLVCSNSHPSFTIMLLTILNVFNDYRQPLCFQIQFKFLYLSLLGIIKSLVCLQQHSQKSITLYGSLLKVLHRCSAVLPCSIQFN